MTNNSDDQLPTPPTPSDSTPNSSSEQTFAESEADTTEQSSKKGASLPWIIAGVVGCGCLGLLGVIGLIAAIALPSLLSQADRARESEGKTYIGSILRGQQAHHIEKGEFASEIEALGLGITTETSNYRYEIVPLADPATSVYITATPVNAEASLRSYGGAVYAVTLEDDSSVTISGFCESDEATTEPPVMPTLSEDETTVDCPPGSSLP